MRTFHTIPNASGAYSSISEKWILPIPNGDVQVADGVELTCGGFGTPTIENGVMMAWAGDETAWAAWKAAQQPDIETLRAAKLDELNAAAQAAITAGCDVTLSDGTTGHISLTAEDQINLSTAQAAVQAGATGYPYHLDGELCKIYTAADILIMAKAAVAHILYNTTYCNHLRAWAQRVTTAYELPDITYVATLPSDLQSNMEAIISAASTT